MAFFENTNFTYLSLLGNIQELTLKINYVDDHCHAMPIYRRFEVINL